MKTILTNGTILTFDQREGNALVIEDDRIVDMGSFDELYQKDMQVIDLQGHTLMPSFIDAHSHLSGYAMGLLQVALDDCHSIFDIHDCILRYIKQHPHATFVKCKNYDQYQLQEKRHITKQEIDDIKLPVFIQHQTGHCGVMNSAALEYLNIDQFTKSPQGGKIDFETGFLEENAFTSYIQKAPMPSIEELKDVYIKAQDIYASYGITTIQDGMVVDGLTDIYKALVDDDVFYLDVVGYVGFDENRFLEEFKDYRDYDHHFKLGGYKMFLDGSPQNKTAWVIDPYVDGSYGYPTLDDQHIYQNIQTAIKEKRQIIAHCNGDQAIQHFIDQYQNAYHKNSRPVIIHAQMLRQEQMEQVKKLEMIPSFFLAHVYYFGDIHLQNMGTRAMTISPLHTTLQYHIPFTMHQDAPVIEPNMLETIEIAVNRKTRNGILLGEEECIHVQDAITAITQNAAYQCFEENQKGTLSVGKKADMIILSDNPLTVKKDHIKDIQVLTTFKDGKIIYQKK